MIQNADKIREIMKMTDTKPRNNQLNNNDYYHGLDENVDYGNDYYDDGKEIPTTEELMMGKFGGTSNAMMGGEQPQQQITSEQISKSRLPREILESFSSTQIDTPNELDNSPADLNKLFGGVANKSKALMSETNNNNKVNYSNNSTSIDYSIIKAIIKQELDEKFEQLYKKLDDGEITIIKLDSKISLIDKKNRLFQGKLETKGTLTK